MSTFAEILGHRVALESLERCLSSGRIPQALLFRGPARVGKATVAKAFAKALLCDDETAGACGRCPACRLVETGSHPDLLTVRREAKRPKAGENPADVAEEDLSAFIRIDQIREMARLAGMAPRQGRRRVFLVDPADRMNPESQNALLKTLEEPPGEAVVILLADRPHLLLPTVRSRCFTLGFSSLPTAELAHGLEARGLPADEARTRAALAEGRPGQALGVELDELRERREGLLEALETLSDRRGALDALPRFAKELAGEDPTALTANLELLEGLLRDAIRLASGAPEDGLVHVDLARRIGALTDRISPARGATLIEGIERARGYLRVNANRTLIAEAVLAAVAGAPVP